MKPEEIRNRKIEILTSADHALAKYFNQHSEIFSEIVGLTEHVLFEDLKEAIKFQHGYFKNDMGEYRYLKGIEVTNDTGNLCRMGYNGEDRGVWVHYCEVDDKHVVYNDVPISAFTYFMTDNVGKKKKFRPTTKEDFDQQVEKTIHNIIADYQEKRDAKEYYDTLNGWNKLYSRVAKKYDRLSDENLEKMFNATIVNMHNKNK